MQTNHMIQNPLKVSENEKGKKCLHVTKSRLFNCSEADQSRVVFEGNSSDSDFENLEIRKSKGYTYHRENSAQ